MNDEKSPVFITRNVWHGQLHGNLGMVKVCGQVIENHPTGTQNIDKYISELVRFSFLNPS